MTRQKKKRLLILLLFGQITYKKYISKLHYAKINKKNYYIIDK